MGESIVKVLGKKLVGYALVLVGLTMLFLAISDLSYYVLYPALAAADQMIETVLYQFTDVLLIISAIVIWFMSVKLLTAKS